MLFLAKTINLGGNQRPGLCEENYNYWLSRHKEVKEKQYDKNQFSLDLA